MTRQDKKKFALLMAKLETAFSEPIPKEKVALYFDYLDDLSIRQIGRAIDYLIERRERRGIPMIAAIRAATLKSIEYKAVEAWGELIGKKLHIEKKFKDPLIAKVTKVAFGSVDAFYQGDERNEMADRAHFLRAYMLIGNLKDAKKERKKLRIGIKGKISDESQEGGKEK